MFKWKYIRQQHEAIWNIKISGKPKNMDKIGNLDDWYYGAYIHLHLNKI